MAALVSSTGTADDEWVAVAETVDFGPLHGHASIAQLRPAAFNRACSSEQEKNRDVDSTGMRIHAGERAR